MTLLILGIQIEFKIISGPGTSIMSEETYNAMRPRSKLKTNHDNIAGSRRTSRKHQLRHPSIRGSIRQIYQQYYRICGSFNGTHIPRDAMKPTPEASLINTKDVPKLKDVLHTTCPMSIKHPTSLARYQAEIFHYKTETEVDTAAAHY